MRRTLVATVAALVSLAGGPASAQGITLFGDARLGLGYNINNDGSVRAPDADGDFPDDLRAVSRVRFGVIMTGETDSGITFGATIRADNARGRPGRRGRPARRQRLRLRRLGHAHLRRHQRRRRAVGRRRAGELLADRPHRHQRDAVHLERRQLRRRQRRRAFRAQPLRPADGALRLRLSAGFGLSVSTDRDLADMAVGAGYAGDFGGGYWSVGVGYYDFASFTTIGDPELTLVDTDGDGAPDAVVEGEPVGVTFPAGDQWSVGLKGEYDAFSFGVTYTALNSDSEDLGQADADNLLLGAAYSFGNVSVGAYYGKILNANGVRRVRGAGRRRRLRPDRAVRPRRRRHGQRRHRQHLPAAGLGQRPARSRQRRDRRLRHPDGVLSGGVSLAGLLFPTAPACASLGA